MDWKGILKKFLNLTVEDLLGSPETYKKQEFVTQLNDKKNFEIASTTALGHLKNGTYLKICL